MRRRANTRLVVHLALDRPLEDHVVVAQTRTGHLDYRQTTHRLPTRASAARDLHRLVVHHLAHLAPAVGHSWLARHPRAAHQAGAERWQHPGRRQVPVSPPSPPSSLLPQPRLVRSPHHQADLATTLRAVAHRLRSDCTASLRSPRSRRLAAPRSRSPTRTRPSPRPPTSAPPRSRRPPRRPRRGTLASTRTRRARSRAAPCTGPTPTRACSTPTSPSPSSSRSSRATIAPSSPTARLEPARRTSSFPSPSHRLRGRAERSRS